MEKRDYPVDLAQLRDEVVASLYDKHRSALSRCSVHFVRDSCADGYLVIAVPSGGCFAAASRVDGEVLRKGGDAWTVARAAFAAALDPMLAGLSAGLKIVDGLKAATAG